MEENAALLADMNMDVVRAPKDVSSNLLSAVFYEEVPQRYLDSVARTHRCIHDGNIFQADLSRRWHTEPFPQVMPAAICRRLRAANPAPFAGLARLGERALISSSPERLQGGCRLLQLHAPSEKYLRGELMSAAAAQAAAVLKLIDTRGCGDPGYQFSSASRTTRILTRYPWPEYPSYNKIQGVHFRICDTHLGHNRQLAGLKHLNRLEPVLARAEWSEIDQVYRKG